MRPGPPAKAITANGWHTCTLGDDGTVTCWGRNVSGECGIDGTEYVTTPQQIPNLGGVTAIVAGVDHSCAVVAGGEVKCWGKNVDGQLGDGETAAREINPVLVHVLEGAVALAAGDDHTCAILGADGTMRCWGVGFSAATCRSSCRRSAA
jgi:alpha-tubulin suppressor-like RCC1 family protein